MTTSLATAASTSPTASTALEAARRRGTTASGGDFSALLGASGGESAPAERRPELPGQSRRAAAHERPEPRPRSAEQRAPGAQASERRREEVAVACAERATLRRQAAQVRDGAGVAARDEREPAVESDVDAPVPDQNGAADGTPAPGGTEGEVAATPAVPAPAETSVVTSPLVPDADLLGDVAPATSLPLVAAPAAPLGAEAAGPGSAIPIPVTLTVPGGQVATELTTADQVAPPAAEAALEPPVALPTQAGQLDVTLLDGTTPLPGADMQPAGAETSPDGGTSGGSGQQQPSVSEAPETVDPAQVVPAPVEGADAVVAGTGVLAGSSTRAETVVAATGPAGSAPTEPASSEALALRTQLGSAVADLARAAHRDGSGATRVVIRLDPPELGTVTVALTVRGGDVRVSLLATETGAMQALDARRADVQAALADAGLALDSYDVQSGFARGQEQQHSARERAASAGRPWRALGPEMDWERAAAVDRAARGVWL